MSLKPINATPTSAPLLGDPPKKAGPPPTAPKTDETRLSFAASTLSAAGAEPAGDPGRIESLRARIADGTYYPNPRAIAEKMLQEAWLTRK